MSTGCGSADPRALVLSLIQVADCQAASLGSDGWHALSGSTLFATLLTGLLTIAVAWHGYRLLGGGAGMLPRDALALLVRIGVVIALATSWQAYDRLVYRVATQGPAELAGAIFPSAGIDTDHLADRLQNAYDAIHVAPPDDAQVGGQNAPSNGNAELKAAKAASAQGPSDAGRDTAATVLLVVGAGTWIATRVVLALLLAIGPIAIAAILFEATAGFAIGWLRALIGSALASLVVPLALALELQMLDGPVRAAAQAGKDEIVGLTPIVWIFALVMLALVVAVQRVAGGIRLPRLRTIVTTGAGEVHAQGLAVAAPAQAHASMQTIAPPVPVAPSRALAIARAAEARAGAGGAAGRGGAAGAPGTPGTSASISRRGTQLADHTRRSSTGRRTPSAKRWNIR